MWQILTPLNRLPRIWFTRKPVPEGQTSALLCGMGTDISVDEAADLLRRLHAETSQVQAIFTCPGGTSSTLRGVLRDSVDDRLWAVKSEWEMTGSVLTFDLSAAMVRRYGDERSMRADASFPFRLDFVSA